MAKKKTKSSTRAVNLNENNIKAVLSLLVLLVAFGVLILFVTYQENLLTSPSLKFFLTLVVLLSSLLVGLLFLMNPQKKK